MKIHTNLNMMIIMAMKVSGRAGIAVAVVFSLSVFDLL
jgi:hypothetical protein